MPPTLPRQAGWDVTLDVPGGNQHQRDRDDAPVASSSKIVHRIGQRRWGEFNEPAGNITLGAASNSAYKKAELLSSVEIA
jgi:hypothetical protein